MGKVCLVVRVDVRTGCRSPLGAQAARSGDVSWDPGTRCHPIRTLPYNSSAAGDVPRRQKCPNRTPVASRRVAHHGSSLTVFRGGFFLLRPGDTARPVRTVWSTGTRPGSFPGCAYADGPDRSCWSGPSSEPTEVVSGNGRHGDHYRSQGQRVQVCMTSAPSRRAVRVQSSTSSGWIGTMPSIRSLSRMPYSAAMAKRQARTLPPSFMNVCSWLL